MPSTFKLFFSSVFIMVFLSLIELFPTALLHISKERFLFQQLFCLFLATTILITGYFIFYVVSSRSEALMYCKSYLICVTVISIVYALVSLTLSYLFYFVMHETKAGLSKQSCTSVELPSITSKTLSVYLLSILFFNTIMIFVPL